jgi:flagellar motor component MotA
MRDIVYLELREKNIEINRIENKLHDNGSNTISVGMELLIGTVEKVEQLSDVARKEGLLALEMEISNLEDIPGKKYYKDLFMLIIDGTEPDRVKDMALLKYFSSVLTDYEAVQYLIIAKGALMIQEGENPRIIEQTLLYMIPEHVAEEYMERQKKICSAEADPLDV